MLLSILVPSKRPDGLAKFMNTFKANTAQPWDFEFVVLVDDDNEFIDHAGNVITIHRKPTKPVSNGEFLGECYKHSTGQWIMFANDDMTFDTFDWDNILRAKIEEYPDELALLWPNDGMLGKNLSCIPIVSRKVLDMVGFFPSPYLRYKVDDTLYYIFPFNRRVYIPEITIRHHNDKGEEGAGFPLGGGRFYPIDSEIAAHDTHEWSRQSSRREDMRNKLSHVASPIKVLIGVSTGEYARRADFYDYVNMMDKPHGSILMYCHDRSPAQARNTIIQQAIESDCTHVLIIDDDMAFRPNALMQLLEHQHLDLVSGLYLSRAYPHRPLIFDVATENGSCAYVNLNGNKERLMPIVAAGFGFCLMKLEIFKGLDKPWVRLGELDPEQWCDDIGFFNRFRKAGYKAWCDMECRVGHIGTMIIWPNYENEAWFSGYDTGSGSVNVPQPIKGEEKKVELQEEIQNV